MLRKAAFYILMGLLLVVGVGRCSKCQQTPQTASEKPRTSENGEPGDEGMSATDGIETPEEHKFETVNESGSSD